MKVLVAMSGGVDSSVAAALARREAEEVVGVTLKLWGGPTDRGCCSVSDVDDARRVADQLGIEHHVFNFGEDFDESVVAPYVQAHAEGRTPNPCVACNRHVKFDLLHRRAAALGFDIVATGHHARVVTRPDGTLAVARGADPAKDQSYVVYMLGQVQLARTWFPVGDRSKAQVRDLAHRLGLRTAAKPDSQDVCFIGSAGGREAFLGERIPLRPGRIVDLDGRNVGAVAAVELVTIGQRKGLGLAGGWGPRFVVDIDVAAATVVVGPEEALLRPTVELVELTWSAGARLGPVLAQCSAHGDAHPGLLEAGGVLRWDRPRRQVAPGQAVVLYDPERPDEVLGGGFAAPAGAPPSGTVASAHG